MIENVKVKFEQRKHYGDVNSSNLETNHDFSKTLVVGEKGKCHVQQKAQPNDLKNIIAITANLQSTSPGFDKQPGRRPIPQPASGEYIPAGKKHIIPPSEKHDTTDTVFDNGGPEPKIGNFPTNFTRFMKGRDFDKLIDQIGQPKSKLNNTGSSTTGNQTSNHSSSQKSFDSTTNKPESKETTLIKINKPVNEKLIKKNMEKNLKEELKQIKNLTASTTGPGGRKKAGKSKSWEEQNGIVVEADDDDF